MAILDTPRAADRQTDLPVGRRRFHVITDWLARPRASFYLVLVPAVLLPGLGMMMVLSASSVFAHVQFGDAYYFVKRQIIFLLIGGVGAWWLARSSPRRLKLLGWGGLALAFVLQLLTYTPLGFEIKGNRNWVQFGTSLFRVQPSELAKLMLIVWGADLLARKHKLLDQPKHLLVPFILVAA
ncbi:MAG: FtsW/RodA/SpoVE family cell cycle protein [Micropruina sp.]|nr:FtsW/RodA/SpoVE family cell cycle protein [Micropruina sp.]